MASILLIDDEVDFADCLREELEESHTVEYLERAEQGADRLAAGKFDVVLLDNIMPRMTGLEFLGLLKACKIKVAVILMTSHPTADTVMDAINLGAFECVVKRGEIGLFVRELQKIIPRAVEFTRPPKEVYVPAQDTDAPPDAPTLVGRSDPMMEVFKLIPTFAVHDYPVLVLGETGTGKELVAQAVHSKSPRKEQPFFVLNCASLTDTLADSQLFGYEPGAFTGANKRSKGLIEHADGGTLFLDEIGELPLQTQAKLLRALQERVIMRLGGHELIPVDFRLVSATNRNLRQAVRDGTFREDLRQRINCLPICLPPLRDRMDDLSGLIDYFVARIASDCGIPRPAVADETRELLRAHHWPGNVRELQNVIRLAFTLCRGGSVLLPAHIKLDSEATGEPTSAPGGAKTKAEAIAALRQAIEWAWDANQEKLWDSLREMLERELYRVANGRLDGNQSQIAEKLGVVWNTVSKRIKEYDLK